VRDDEKKITLEGKGNSLRERPARIRDSILPNKTSTFPVDPDTPIIETDLRTGRKMGCGCFPKTPENIRNTIDPAA
jgi:hypothetical protein